MTARVHALIEDKVDREIFHGGIEEFFDRLGGTVNFVDKEDVAVFQMGEHADQIPPLLKSRPRSHRERTAGFIGDDVRQGCFAQPGRTVKEDVIHGFRPQFGSFDGNPQRLDRLLLSHIVIQVFRSQGKNFGCQVLGGFPLR